MLRFLCLIPKILRNDPFMHTYIATITWEHSLKPTQRFCKWMTGRHAVADRVFLQFDNEQDRKFTNTAEKQNRYFLSLCRRANVSDMIFCLHAPWPMFLLFLQRPLLLSTPSITAPCHPRNVIESPTCNLNTTMPYVFSIPD